MWFAQRKMVALHENEGNGNNRDLSHQLCFVHRLAELPVIAASIDQAATYYDKVKKYNSLLTASLNLAENGLKYAVGKVEPIRRLLDSPIVLVNKIGCAQLEKIVTKYPSVKKTPEELYENGKVYYDNSYAKGVVDKGVVVAKTAIDTYNNSLIKTGVDTSFAIWTFIPRKMIGAGQLYYSLILKPTTEHAFAAICYLPRRPDMAILVVTQGTMSTITDITDYVDNAFLSYLPGFLHQNIVVVVDYMNYLKQDFNEASSLGQLTRKVLNEARDKAIVVLTIAGTVIDRICFIPPLTWAGYIAKSTNDVVIRALSNGANGGLALNNGHENEVQKTK